MRTFVAVVTPPQPIITAAEVRARLGISDSDDTLNPLIKAACVQIEPPDGWVGRAFGRQTLELRCPWFAAECGDLRLRCPPLVQVDSVKYTDTTGQEQTLASSTYTVIGAGGTDIARLALAYGASWPSVRSGDEALRVRYQAGYASGDARLEPARHAVCLAVKQLLTLSTRDLYLSNRTVEGIGSRSYVLSDVASKLIGAAVDSLLQGYRVWG